MGTFPPKQQNRVYLISTLFRQMPLNIQLNWIKSFYREKQKRLFGEKVQDCKDGSGLKFISFDFVTGAQEIKVFILVEF